MSQTQYYNLKLQAQGRLVVPTAVRADLHVQEGDEVILVKDGQGYRLTTRAALIEAATGSLAREDGRDLVRELLDERQQEARAKGW
jgi:AbrB family transcriptional regulator (stage V sporulation protein T)